MRRYFVFNVNTRQADTSWLHCKGPISQVRKKHVAIRMFCKYDETYKHIAVDSNVRYRPTLLITRLLKVTNSTLLCRLPINSFFVFNHCIPREAITYL